MNNTNATASKTSATKKGLFILVALGFVLLIALAIRQGSSEVEVEVDEARVSIQLNVRNDILTITYPELTIEDAAYLALENFNVYASYDEQTYVEEDIIDRVSIELVSSDETTAVLSDGTFDITIEGLDVESQTSEVTVTVTDTEYDLTGTASFRMYFESPTVLSSASVDDSTTSKYSTSSDGFSFTTDVTTPDVDDLDGIVSDTVDDEDMADYAGTESGDEALTDDYSYDENGVLEQEDSSEGQDYDVVEKPQAETKVETIITYDDSKDQETAVTEGTVNTPADNEDSSSLSTSVGTVYVLATADSNAYECVLYGNGTGFVVVTLDELGLVDLGGGLYNSIYGILTIN